VFQSLFENHTLDKDFFEVIDTEEKAYILGFIAADGSVYGNTLSIELKRSDKEHLVKINKCLGSDRPIENTLSTDKRVDKVYQAARISQQSKKLITDLAKYGIVPNKTASMAIAFALIPDIFLRDFWRGCIDGDGWLSEGSIPVVGLTGTKNVLESFQLFIKNTLDIDFRAITPNRSIFNTKYYKDHTSVAKCLYKNSCLYLDRKFIIAKSWYTEKEQPESCSSPVVPS